MIGIFNEEALIISLIMKISMIFLIIGVIFLATDESRKNNKYINETYKKEVVTIIL